MLWLVFAEEHLPPAAGAAPETAAGRTGQRTEEGLQPELAAGMQRPASRAAGSHWDTFCLLLAGLKILGTYSFYVCKVILITQKDETRKLQLRLLLFRQPGKEWFVVSTPTRNI